MFAKSSFLYPTNFPLLRVSKVQKIRLNAQERAMWYPGATPPKHLDGSLLGDYGFDPLGLGANPATISWYREAELMNGRWAMMAVPGILLTDAVGLPKFWEAGAKVDLPLPLTALIIIEVVIMGILEYKRYEGFKKTGEVGFLGMMPFDPVGLSSDENKLKELKNGRLAMLAFLGFCSQAAVTGKGPIECLQDHISDPLNNNIYTSSVGPEVTIAVIFTTIWPFITEIKKATGNITDKFRPIPW